MKEKFDLNKLVLVGETTEASLRRTSEILRDQGLNPSVTIEFISKEQGVFSGYGEISQIISRFLPKAFRDEVWCCLLYTSPSPRARTRSRMPSSA